MAKKILDTVHDTAKGLHKAGVMDTKTMREFDALCLTPVKSLSAAAGTSLFMPASTLIIEQSGAAGEDIGAPT